jgi:hypothetical protein
MALTKNREVDHYVDQELRTLGVGAAKNIFKGALVGLSGAGYAQPLVAGDPFVGIAYEQSDNTGGANGAVAARVYTVGDFGFPLAGATVAHIGRPVFASADDTLTFTGAGNSYLGTVQEVPASGEIVLRIDPQRMRIKTIVHVVEDLSAGVDIAARAIHSFDSAGWIVSARAANQATASAGIDNANPCVIALATDAGAVVTATFNATNTFPGVNAKKDLGAISNPFSAAGHVMTLAVTNGATANPGPFLVEVDYV